MNARAHKVCMKDICVHTGIIVVARETHQTELGNTGGPSLQGPVTITASNLGVLIPTPRMHTEEVTHKLHILFPGKLLLLLSVSSLFVTMFWVKMES